MCEGALSPTKQSLLHEAGKPPLVGGCFGKNTLAKTNVR